MGGFVAQLLGLSAELPLVTVLLWIALYFVLRKFAYST